MTFIKAFKSAESKSNMDTYVVNGFHICQPLFESIFIEFVGPDMRRYCSDLLSGSSVREWGRVIVGDQRWG